MRLSAVSRGGEVRCEERSGRVGSVGSGGWRHTYAAHRESGAGGGEGGPAGTRRVTGGPVPTRRAPEADIDLQPGHQSDPLPPPPAPPPMSAASSRADTTQPPAGTRPARRSTMFDCLPPAEAAYRAGIGGAAGPSRPTGRLIRAIPRRIIAGTIPLISDRCHPSRAALYASYSTVYVYWIRLRHLCSDIAVLLCMKYKINSFIKYM